MSPEHFALAIPHYQELITWHEALVFCNVSSFTKSFDLF